MEIGAKAARKMLVKLTPEQLTNIKCKAWCFPTSEIRKISCYTELQAFVTPLIYNMRNNKDNNVINILLAYYSVSKIPQK